jgi:dTDP-4-amino-4,6-dideoxygalactose transaminase
MTATMNRKTPVATAKSPPVPLLDVGRGNEPIRDEILAALARVVDSGRFLFGPDVKQLEESVAKLAGSKHAIACASGSDALLLALLAIGIQPGDEVIVPSFTFFATASAAWRLGAKPVFVDIDPITFNLDPQRVDEAVTPATKAIIPVHLFGQCAEMDAICLIARQHGLTVIEDAAQAVGARYRGRGAGSMGEIGCFSFYPTKNLGGMGDGGMLTTSNDVLAEKLRLFAAHGMNPRYYHHVVGINSRLDSLQAAVLNVKLNHLADWTTARQTNAARYQDMFETVGLDEVIGLPRAYADCEHAWNQYTIRVPHSRRDELRAKLAAHGIGTEVYYPVPLHLQKCFESLGYASGSLPHTEVAAHEVLSLPIFPELTISEQELVVAGIADALHQWRAAAA